MSKKKRLPDDNPVASESNSDSIANFGKDGWELVSMKYRSSGTTSDCRGEFAILSTKAFRSNSNEMPFGTM